MFVVWLTGISGAGKSTLGRELYRIIQETKKPVEFLDGDEIRLFFGNDLGYTKEDRIANNKRIIFAAKVLERNDVIVIVANIAPYAAVRQFAKDQLRNYIQVYVKATPELCAQRDVKGHYAKVTSGQMLHFIGKDDEYEVPEAPDVIVETEQETVTESIQKILLYLKEKVFL